MMIHLGHNSLIFKTLGSKTPQKLYMEMTIKRPLGRNARRFNNFEREILSEIW